MELIENQATYLRDKVTPCLNQSVNPSPLRPSYNGAKCEVNELVTDSHIVIFNPSRFDGGKLNA